MTLTNKIKHIAMFTAMPGPYLVGKLMNLDFTWQDFKYYPATYFFTATGIGLNLFLNFGIYLSDNVFNKDEEYSFQNHSIKIQHSKEDSYLKEDITAKDAIYFVSTPLIPLADLFFNDSYTIIDTKYKIQGEDIINYFPEQGYVINETAFIERDFFVGNKKYNQKNLETELNELYENFDEFQQELKENSKEGFSSNNLKSSSEYYKSIQDKEAMLKDLIIEKNNLITNLKKTANNLKEETYNLRTKVKKKADEIEQKYSKNSLN